MFNEKIFKRIKEIHLKILNKKVLEPEIVSNQYLFLARFHPELLKRFVLNKNLNIFKKFRSYIPYLFLYFIDFFKTSFFISKVKIKKKKIIFISSFEHIDHFNRKNPHIGNLIEAFKKKTFFEIIKSHLPINLKKIVRFKNRFNRDRILLKNNIGFIKEIKIFISLFRNFNKVKKKTKTKTEFEKKIIFNAFSLRAILSSINNYRF